MPKNETTASMMDGDDKPEAKLRLINAFPRVEVMHKAMLTEIGE